MTWDNYAYKGSDFVVNLFVCTENEVGGFCAMAREAGDKLKHRTCRIRVTTAQF